MLDLPQRRLFATRDDFAAAVTAAFTELYARYEGEAVSLASPDWAEGPGCYSVSLPIAVAREGQAPHGISSIVKHAIELKKTSIVRLARVERDGFWTVFYEVK